MTSNVRSIVFVLGFLFISVTAFVITVALLPHDERTNLVVAVFNVIAGVPAVLAWRRASDAAKGTAENAKRLNGDLDDRIQENTHAAIEAYMTNRSHNDRAVD